MCWQTCDIYMVPRFASTITSYRGPRPWREFTHGPPITAEILEEKGATRQDTRMAMYWGGGGTRNGAWKAFRRPSGSPGQGDLWGEGERGDHENTLPFVGRVMGKVRLYGERGRGEGGK